MENKNLAKYIIELAKVDQAKIREKTEQELNAVLR